MKLTKRQTALIDAAKPQAKLYRGKSPSVKTSRSLLEGRLGRQGFTGDDAFYSGDVVLKGPGNIGPIKYARFTRSMAGYGRRPLYYFVPYYDLRTEYKPAVGSGRRNADTLNWKRTKTRGRPGFTVSFKACSGTSGSRAAKPTGRRTRSYLDVPAVREAFNNTMDGWLKDYRPRGDSRSEAREKAKRYYLWTAENLADHFDVVTSKIIEVGPGLRDFQNEASELAANW